MQLMREPGIALAWSILGFRFSFGTGLPTALFSVLRFIGTSPGAVPVLRPFTGRHPPAWDQDGPGTRPKRLMQRAAYPCRSPDAEEELSEGPVL